MLMRLQIANDLSRIVQNFLDKGHHFTSLDLDKVAFLIKLKYFFKLKTNRLHFCAILINVSHAISWTPSCVSCINSNNLLTTVFKNFQWARRKRGYCPTTYMMLDAMIALLSLPRFCSHKPSKSWVFWLLHNVLKICQKTLMTMTRKRFSVSSLIAPEIEPIAQHSVFKFFHDHSESSTFKLFRL